MSRRGTRAHSLEPEDLARLGMDTPINPMVVTVLLRLDGRIALETLVGLVETRVLRHERMREIVVRSRLFHRAPSWQEDRASARERVTRVVLPGTSTETDLADLVSDLMSVPLDPSKSPWRLWLVDDADASTLVFRIHHVVADGSSLLRLLFAFSDEAAAVVLPELPRAPSANAVARGSRAAALGRLLATRSDPASALSGPLSGRKRIAWTAPIDVASLREAAHAVDAHINDVFLALVGGVVAAVAHPEPGDVIHALVPVALTDDGGRFGNHFVSLFVPLPTTVAASPAARVRAARDAMKDVREHAGVPLGKTLVAGAALLGLHAERLAARVLSRKASLVATNLAGPRSALHVGGLLVRDVMFAAPATGSIAVSASAFSYAGKLRIVIAADAAVVPDPSRIARLFDALGQTTIGALRGP